MENIRIPFYQPELTDLEKDHVNRCLSSNWLSWRGPFVKEFEQHFAEFIGVSYTSATCNGTSSLHLALMLLGIKAGDEVIIPALTYISVANVVAYVRATPVFADSEPGTWLISPQHVSSLITKKTKAIIAVHLYGAVCDMEQLKNICETKGIYIIEDCSEALGSSYQNSHVGSFGIIGTFSFYANKTITTGEGGMVVTKIRNIYTECNKMKNMYYTDNDDYSHSAIGFNYRMTNIAAALGLAQLHRLNHTIMRKNNISDLYRSYLNNNIDIFQLTNEKSIPCWWLNAIMTNSQIERDHIRKALSDEGIQTKLLFRPLNTLPPFKKYNSETHVANALWARGLCLPSSSSLTQGEIEEICHIVKGILS